LASTVKDEDSAKINEQTNDKNANPTKRHIGLYTIHKPTLQAKTQIALFADALMPFRP
jgi:hypothetical protein